MNKHKNQRELQNLLVKANMNTSPAGAHTFSGSLCYTGCLKLTRKMQVPGKQSLFSDASEAHTALLAAERADLPRSAKVGTVLVLMFYNKRKDQRQGTGRRGKKNPNK